MYVCMNVCVYECINVCIYECMCVRMNAFCMNVCMYDVCILLPSPLEC